MEILSQEYTLSPLPLPGILAIFWSGKSALWKLNMQTRDLAAADLKVLSACAFVYRTGCYWVLGCSLYLEWRSQTETSVKHVTAAGHGQYNAGGMSRRQPDSMRRYETGAKFVYVVHLRINEVCFIYDLIILVS
ncbi:hypothetical protein V6N13_002156 [Hibiscus sabdariffa]